MAKFNRDKVTSKVKAPTSPVKTSTTPNTRTALGGVGYTRDSKSELYLLAVSNFVGQDLFHEKAPARDDRFEQLVHAVAVADPEWTLEFVTWLRSGGNMRSASLVAGAEACRALMAAGNTDGWARKLISAPLQRADEPGEMLSYWAAYSETKAGKALKLPKPVKRGVADAVRRLYTERNLLKWDGTGKGMRFGDVLELAHPRALLAPYVPNQSIADVARAHEVDPDDVASELLRVASRIEADKDPDVELRSLFSDEAKAKAYVFAPRFASHPDWRIRTAAKVIGVPTAELAQILSLTREERATWQGQLFKYAIDRRHGREDEIPESLHMVRLNRGLRDGGNDPERMLNSGVLNKAGMTWEDVLSMLGSKMPKKELWEAIIPNMGIFALVRNLRNFSEAGIGRNFRNLIALKLDDEEVIRKSRMFPFRFLAAYRAAGNDLNWVYPLEQALNHSLSNVPALPGRTLILVDQSPSMFPGPYYAGNAAGAPKSDISFADQAKVFGSALAMRAENADLVQYGFKPDQVHFRAGESLLKVMERFNQRDGTDTPAAARAFFKGHDRVVILTDEQTTTTSVGGIHRYVEGDWARQVGIPQSTPIYTWNLAGYKAAHLAGTPARHWFAGMTDQAFSMISLLESGVDGWWPWQAAEVNA